MLNLQLHEKHEIVNVIRSELWEKYSRVSQ